MSMRRSIKEKLDITRPVLEITDDVEVEVIDDIKTIIIASEVAQELAELIGDEEKENNLTPEDILKVYDKIDEVFKMLIATEKDYKKLDNLKLNLKNKMVIMEALFSMAQLEDPNEVKDKDGFQE